MQQKLVKLAVLLALSLPGALRCQAQEGSASLKPVPVPDAKTTPEKPSGAVTAQDERQRKWGQFQKSKDTSQKDTAPTKEERAKAQAKEALAKAKAKSRELKAKAKAKADAEAKAKALDVNTATKDQLKQLPGITEAYADAILAKRPYRSKAELTTKGALPLGIFQMVQKQVIVRDPKL